MAARADIAAPRRKRAFDVLGAWIGLVVFAVPSAVIALLVRTTSPGPVLFRQKRVGLHGFEFELIKFRTTLAGTHDEVMRHRDQQLEYVENDFKLPADDPRITPVGRVLRKLSIDEVPQFVNVLRGEMSLVGIRPVERAQLEMRPLSDQLHYTSMRPGPPGCGRSRVAPASFHAIGSARPDLRGAVVELAGSPDPPEDPARRTAHRPDAVIADPAGRGSTTYCSCSTTGDIVRHRSAVVEPADSERN